MAYYHHSVHHMAWLRWRAHRHERQADELVRLEDAISVEEIFTCRTRAEEQIAWQKAQLAARTQRPRPGGEDSVSPKKDASPFGEVRVRVCEVRMPRHASANLFCTVAIGGSHSTLGVAAATPPVWSTPMMSRPQNQTSLAGSGEATHALGRDEELHTMVWTCDGT